MAEEPERKRPEVHWRDLVKACRSIRHVVSSTDTKWCWISLFYVPEEGAPKAEVMKQLKESFEKSTRNEDHDEEVFRKVDNEFRKIRQIRRFNHVTIKECFYLSAIDDFDPSRWNKGQMLLVDFIREARSSWENKTHDQTLEGHSLLKELIQTIQKSHQAVETRIQALEEHFSHLIHMQSEDVVTRCQMVEEQVSSEIKAHKQTTESRLLKLETQVEDLSQPPNLQ
jgi:hypothetical protein